jgi:hypothetical protein
LNPQFSSRPSPIAPTTPPSRTPTTAAFRFGTGFIVTCSPGTEQVIVRSPEPVSKTKSSNSVSELDIVHQGSRIAIFWPNASTAEQLSE